MFSWATTLQCIQTRRWAMAAEKFTHSAYWYLLVTRALLPASSLSFIMSTDEQWRKMLALMEIIWSCAMRLDVLIKLILLNNTFAFLAISTILKHRTVFIIFGSCYCVARCAHNRPYFIFCYTPKSASFVLVTSMLRFRSMHVHHRYLILAFICYFNVLIFTIFFFHIKIDL